MRCHEFETRLNEVLDQRLAPEADHKLRGHARRCGRCAEMLEAYQSLSVGLSRIAAPEPGDGFSFRVMHQAVARQRTRRVSGYFGGFAAAAAILFITVVVWRGAQTNQLPARPARLIANLDYGSLARQTGQFASAFGPPHIVLVGQLAEGFEPMRDSFYAALDALKRTLPAEGNHT